MNAPRDTEQANTPVVLRIATAGEDSACYFWSGLFRRGALRPQQLFARDQQQMLSLAAQQGVCEDEAIMLSSTEQDPPRFTYLVPAPASPLQNDTHAVQAVVKALRLWQPRCAGLYLDPQLIAPQPAATMLLQIVRAALLTAAVREFCLATGAQQHNDLLNTTVWLKENLEKEAINASIYH